MGGPAVIGAVLAGGGRSDFAAAHGVETKALIRVAGRPLVTYVVEALQAAKSIDEVVVVCSPGGLLPDEAVLAARQITASGEGFEDSVAAAARASSASHVCLVTADLPALTGEAVDATAKFALDSDADLTYTISEIGKVAEAFPGTVRTTVRLREGEFTGGNFIVARPEALLGALATIGSAFGRRKSIVGLTLLLGPMFLLRLVLGRLSVADAAARGEQILGCRVAVHESPYPEIGFDVDKPSDLELAEALLSRRAQNAGA
jgi:GTP:adenosylcobinamide-phosphate guanylyltransferase